MLDILLSIWLSASLAYLLFDIVLAYHISQIKTNSGSKVSEGISVIIAAHNEAKNLKQNLPQILKQNHIKFEVLVVDDNSNDNTVEVLCDYQAEYPKLRYISIQTEKPSKKYALTEGIREAKYEILSFTDADCWPETHNWLSTMERFISDRTPIVLGFSPFQKKDGFLNKLIRYETVQTAINYFGLAKAGMPYMAVGRNLMYKKEVFKTLNGYQNHEHIISGDDDLFINDAVANYKIALCIDSESFVTSTPESTFKSWTAQKRRHITTANHYGSKQQFVLSLQVVVRFLFWYGAIFTIAILPIDPVWKFSNLIFFVLIIGLKPLVLKSAFKRFKSKDLVVASGLLDFLLLNFQLYIFLCNLIEPKKDW